MTTHREASDALTQHYIDVRTEMAVEMRTTGIVTPPRRLLPRGAVWELDTSDPLRELAVTRAHKRLTPEERAALIRGAAV